MVVGQIAKMEKHPDADKLQICQMDVGEDEPVQIVTGADNVFEGALVPAALHDSHAAQRRCTSRRASCAGVASNGHALLRARSSA